MALLRSARHNREKKSARAAEQERPDILRRREAWFEGQLDLDPARLVFIDETWASTNMARMRGRAPRGQRLRAAIPYGHWKTTTLVAGLRQDGIMAPFVLDGPINRRAFETYLAKVLVPELRQGDIIIMDNLSSHKGPKVKQLIEAAAQAYATFPLTRPTSIPSRTPSPSSRRSCARPPSEPSTPSGTGSASFSMPSRPPNATTTSKPLDTMQPERIRL